MTLKLSSNMIDDFNNETSFPYKLLPTDRQVLKLWKVFATNSPANIKSSKTWLFKIVQSGGMYLRHFSTTVINSSSSIKSRSP